MDQHLNLFKFFNSSDEDHLEDNLSRGFALCSRYDNLFLDKVLHEVLGADEYKRLFETDFPDYSIEIDLQNRVNGLSEFNKIIGVTCSGESVATFDDIEAFGAISPETDVCFQVHDTCILFEFKRTNENCAAQLKAQVEGVKANSPSAVVKYTDLCWPKIIQILLNVSSLQKQTSTENPFTRDLISFLESIRPEWFPDRQLRNIPFSTDEGSSNSRLLNIRLNNIKMRSFGEDAIKDFRGTHDRRAIKVNFGWINEVNIGPDNIKDNQFITVSFHFGDTKEQGKIFFDKIGDRMPDLATFGGFQTVVSPYIKFSNAFGKGLLSIKLSKEEFRRTHTRQFFEITAKKWNRTDWPVLANILEPVISNWETRCTAINSRPDWNWNSQFVTTNRSSLLLSLGIHLQVLIPYSKCQELDDQIENPSLAKTFKQLIEEVKERIDGTEVAITRL